MGRLRAATFLATAALAVALAPLAEARDFTIVGWGGAAQDTQRKVFFQPFAEQEGITFQEDTYLGGWGQFQAMQDSGVVPWDVVQVETAEMTRGCEEGMFLELDWSRLGGKEKFIPTAVSPCGAGTIVWAVLLAYNDEKIGDKKPTDFADFWDIETWPGKRGMRAGPKLNLEFALMADGVPPAEVYEALSTPEGIDRAFAKLDELKPHIQWWEAGAQAPEWLAAGDVTMSIAYNGRISGAQEKGVPLMPVWDNTIYAVDSWVILANSPHIDTGYRFIEFASDPKRQAQNAMHLPYGPTNVDTVKELPPKVVANLPAGDNLATALFGGSEEATEFWVDHQEELTERWTAWTAR